MKPLLFTLAAIAIGVGLAIVAKRDGNGFGFFRAILVVLVGLIAGFITLRTPAESFDNHYKWWEADEESRDTIDHVLRGRLSSGERVVVAAHVEIGSHWLRLVPQGWLFIKDGVLILTDRQVVLAQLGENQEMKRVWTATRAQARAGLKHSQRKTLRIRWPDGSRTTLTETMLSNDLREFRRVL